MTAQMRDVMPDRVGMAKPAMGTAVLNGITTVNVPCPSLTANSLIFTNVLIVTGTLGLIGIVSRTPGVGFAVSSVALNSSTIAWMVVEP